MGTVTTGTSIAQLAALHSASVILQKSTTSGGIHVFRHISVNDRSTVVRLVEATRSAMREGEITMTPREIQKATSIIAEATSRATRKGTTQTASSPNALARLVHHIWLRLRGASPHENAAALMSSVTEVVNAPAFSDLKSRTEQAVSELRSRTQQQARLANIDKELQAADAQQKALAAFNKERPTYRAQAWFDHLFFGHATLLTDYTDTNHSYAPTTSYGNPNPRHYVDGFDKYVYDAYLERYYRDGVVPGLDSRYGGLFVTAEEKERFAAFSQHISDSSWPELAQRSQALWDTFQSIVPTSKAIEDRKTALTAERGRILEALTPAAAAPVPAYSGPQKLDN